MSRATHATALTRRLFHACSETGDLLPRLFLSEPFFISSAVLPHPPSPTMSAPNLAGNSSAYVCDTLPPPRLAGDKSASRSPTPSPPSPPAVTTFDPPIIVSSPEPSALAQMDSANAKAQDAKQADTATVPAQPPARKLCVRHQRMADEGTNLKLQQVSPVSRPTHRTQSPLPYHAQSITSGTCR